MVDPNGSYEEDGHFWTIYLMYTMMGNKNAFDIAHAAEAPDLNINRDGDVVSESNTWMNFDDQENIHSLNGEYSLEATLHGEIMIDHASNIKDLGEALHYYGDSYARREMGSPLQMYPHYIGHLFKNLAGYFNDSALPDNIANRTNLYQQYVLSLALILHANIDRFPFFYIANSHGSTEENDAIFETEIRIRESKKNYDFQGDQVNTINDYLSKSNSHYHRTIRANITTGILTHFQKNSHGQWLKLYRIKTYVTFE